ncbi:MAG: right-handed parallel beta-helix repeat-containing protein [Candidatus Micrarchaeota archaeon]|nr:right-handed parallel beta-helix repeat-containing protein [Candidatus Micrarchaeota archaeon]
MADNPSNGGTQQQPPSVPPAQGNRPQQQPGGGGQQPAQGMMPGPPQAGGWPADKEAQQIDKIVTQRRKQAARMRIMAALIGLIIVVGIAYYALVVYKPPVTTTSTTTRGINTEYLASCGTISQPGLYYLSGDISTQISNGTCIDIESSNVWLIGGQHVLQGNGPFVQVPPYTYAIKVGPYSNVSIGALNITKFSYGIYLDGSRGDTIKNVTVRNSTITGIYLRNAWNSSVILSKSEQAQGQSGGIYLQGGGNNTILNNTVEYNTAYGIRINGSTGNRFAREDLIANPVDFYCDAASGFVSQNRYGLSTCYVNNGCSFVQCSTTNNASNVSSIQLQLSLNGCGSITVPGSYSLGRNLNMLDYINRSQKSSETMPCINVAAQNVRLDCNGHTISNAAYGIYSISRYNVTVTNCRLNNNTYGMFFANPLQFSISNDTFTNNTYSLYEYNATQGNLTNVTFLGNKYGAYFNGSQLYRIRGYQAHNNQYGAFSDRSNELNFMSGNVTSNTKADFYCSTNEYNYTTNNFNGIGCGSTDCKWAYPQCRTYILPPLQFFPLNTCTNIVSPGAYALTANLVGQNGCLVIKSSNVTINCRGFSIDSKSSTGSAILMQNMSAVGISNCPIFTFNVGVNVINSRDINITNVTSSKANTGFWLYNTAYSSFVNDSALNYSQTGFTLSGISYSNVSRDVSNATTGSLNGFIFKNSKNNTISFNYAYLNTVYGFVFNASRNNTIFNNSATTNAKDYYCTNGSTGLNAEKNGINYGVSKVNCYWLVAQRKLGLGQQCFPITTPTLISMSQDLAYTFNQTCFNSYNTSTSIPGGTVINCNGHTIVATNGGTFLNIENGTNIKIQNCYLKGFTTPIVTSGQETLILNNTFSNASTAITASHSTFGTLIYNNTILSAGTGILLKNMSNDNINYNRMTNVTNGITVKGSDYNNINGDTVSATGTGISLMGGSVVNNFNGTAANGAVHGLACYGTSGYSSAPHNFDKGQNSCSSNFQCAWISVSSSQCH